MYKELNEFHRLEPLWATMAFAVATLWANWIWGTWFSQAKDLEIALLAMASLIGWPLNVVLFNLLLGFVLARSQDQVLLRTVPEPRGTVLDIGCGWGPIAIAAALSSPDVTVTAVDVNERALDLARRNAATAGVGDRVHVGLPSVVPDNAMFDTIWSNPPIRIGKAALHDLLATWLPRLNTGGEAWLVVQRNLGADSLAVWLAEQGWGEVEKVASAKGFRVLRLRAA